jgi:hypothetical protein
MTVLRRAMMALLAVVMLVATGMAGAASTTNFSDQWWIENESGWGASVLQQSDVLFIDLFVYGTDGKPTWFTAAAFLQGNAPAGHVLFTGDLHSTTGPYYGGSFNSGAVGYAKVGTLTFDADTVNPARLSYSVNGVPIAKNVTRQTWRNENLSGSYYGGNVGEQTACGADTGHYEEETFIQINHAADNSITMTWTDLRNRSMNFNGTYSQSGHMGQIVGTGRRVDLGLNATVNLFEIERTIAGITGRGHIVLQSSDGSCTWDGWWGGVRR